MKNRFAPSVLSSLETIISKLDDMEGRTSSEHWEIKNRLEKLEKKLDSADNCSQERWKALSAVLDKMDNSMTDSRINMSSDLYKQFLKVQHIYDSVNKIEFAVDHLKYK